jgi:hypothetical protein
MDFLIEIMIENLIKLQNKISNVCCINPIGNDIFLPEIWLGKGSQK